MSGVCLVKLVDDKYQVGGSCHGKCIHDNSMFSVCINTRATCQLLGIVDGAHVQSRPRKLQDSCYRIGDLGFTGTCRSDEKKSVSRQGMGTVDLDNGLDDTLFHTLHSVKLFVQDSSCFHRVDGFEVIVFPLDVQHNGKSSLCVMALFLGNLAGSCHCQVSSGPQADVIRQGFACAGHKIGDALKAGKLHLIPCFLLILVLLCFCRCIALKETLDHKLQKAVLCGKLGAAPKGSLSDAVHSIAVLCIRS